MDSDAILKQACEIVGDKVMENVRDTDEVTGAVVLLVTEKGVFGSAHDVEGEELVEVLGIALEQAMKSIEKPKPKKQAKPKTKRKKAE